MSANYCCHVYPFNPYRLCPYGHDDGNRLRGGHNEKWLDGIKEDCSDLGTKLHNLLKTEVIGDTIRAYDETQSAKPTARVGHCTRTISTSTQNASIWSLTAAAPKFRSLIRTSAVNRGTPCRHRKFDQ